MNSVTVKILFTFVLQTIANPDNNVVNPLVDKLSNRKLDASQNSDLDGTVLGKPGRLVSLSKGTGVLQSRPIVSYKPAWQSGMIMRQPLLQQDTMRPLMVQAEHSMEGTTLHNLAPAAGAYTKKKRLARGYGGKGGGTAGRGTRGQKSRSGGGVRSGFEGGQTPLYRRLPKLKGVGRMKKVFMKRIWAINVGQLQKYVDSGKLDASVPITKELLLEKGIARRPHSRDGIKLLGDGELKTPLTIDLQYASETAKKAVEESGGKLNIYVKPKWTRKPAAKAEDAPAEEAPAEEEAPAPA
eukprot:gnl/MRDRNA2_/MRDRNA2_82814_c0_seq1.p1 gnl/MRDRNA2_/MRDRNA2_82814_c0~~gnl/MRDRNA2_/MRDRNA2_82814_c0_seq1.p1  ORF type:complete len:297 (-),score=76.33 gnl/MRDRNA2_/MRDRNA2_82814_c0_seq1:504-1394(-)